MKFKPRHFGSNVNIRHADAKHPQNPPIKNLVEQSTVHDAGSSVKGMVKTVASESGNAGKKKKERGWGHSLLLCML